MAARLSWKAYLRLSLVSVPVQAFNAVEAGECAIALHQLHEACHSRIRYEKVCPIHGTVSKDEIVSGYEYAKDQYVVMDAGELQKLRTESDKSIRIDSFVAPDAVDPIHFDGRSYYLLPDGLAGRRPYAVFEQAMIAMGRYALGQGVFSGKEQVVMLRPYQGLLMLAMLNPARCLRQPADLPEHDIGREKVGKEELKLAETLIRASAAETFDLADYQDNYTQRLRDLIEAKVQGREIVAPPEAEEPPVINLMDALKQSVARSKKVARREPRGKRAPTMRPAARRGKKSS